MSGGVMVAGIGNVFLTDDGFGVEVANRLLASGSARPGVKVVDYGIRGVHLAYELLEGYDALILIDAVPMGEQPGTLAIVEPEPYGGGSQAVGVVDAHTMSPDVVLATLAHLGVRVSKIYVIGCQPACLAEGMGLTPPVASAVDFAVGMCRDLLTEILQPAGKGT